MMGGSGDGIPMGSGGESVVKRQRLTSLVVDMCKTMPCINAVRVALYW